MHTVPYLEMFTKGLPISTDHHQLSSLFVTWSVKTSHVSHVYEYVSLFNLYLTGMETLRSSTAHISHVSTKTDASKCLNEKTFHFVASPTLPVDSNLWASSCVGQPSGGLSVYPACGTWHCRWAPVTPAHRWSCSSCLCDVSQSGYGPLCAGEDIRHQKSVNEQSHFPPILLAEIHSK